MRQAACAALALVGIASLPFPATSIDLERFVQPADAITITDRHGTPLRRLGVGGADRRWVPLARVAPELVDAVIATEDQRFRAHGGLDARALARALCFDLVPGHRLSGASTITEQLVKLVYGREWGIWSKGVEMERAAALEHLLTKDEILEQYLNRLPYGNGIVGAERASEVYFGHPASELTLSEAALLAGIPQAPSLTEPLRHRHRALARRALVLARMRALHARSDAALAAADADLPQTVTGTPRPWRAPRFVDVVARDERGGRVHADDGLLVSSLDLPLQDRAEAVVGAAVEALGARGATNGAALVVRNATGEVLAYVGAAHDGAGHAGGELDLLRARRRPGSALKPFVYELLFESGGSAATIVDDVSRPMTGNGGALFTARDYDGVERGPVRARVALSGSLNLAALDAARRVGAERVVARLDALGVEGVGTAEERGAAVVLGGLDVSPWELAQAYVTLARGGTRVPLVVVPHGPAAGARVMDAASVAVTRDVLEDGRARSDAFGADLEQAAGGPFALKTGTSTGWHDAWAAAFDDDFTVVVWLGDPWGRPMGALSGFEGAAPVAASILAAARARRPALGETAPRDTAVRLETTRVCALTGLVPGPRCRHVITERFAPGTAPTARCDVHRDDGTSALPARYADWIARTHPTGVVLAETAAPSVAEVRIVQPTPGSVLLVDAAHAAPRTALRATISGTEVADVHWEVDGTRLGEPHLTLTPGSHTIVATVGGHRSEPAHVEVRTTDDRG